VVGVVVAVVVVVVVVFELALPLPVVGATVEVGAAGTLVVVLPVDGAIEKGAENSFGAVKSF
jgi:hypothetical protein